jgi:hypothetical protein
MNSVTLDWLDLTIILSTFAACAVVGWYAGCLMNRFQVVKPIEVVRPIEPVAPMVDAQRIEVTLVDRGWRRWKRTAVGDADGFQGSAVQPEKSSPSLSLINKAIDRTEGFWSCKSVSQETVFEPRLAKRL